jgi:PAS domain S-box-containing protein
LDVFHSVRSAELSEAMNLVRVAVVVWDEDGTIVLANQAAADLFGQTLSELVGRHTSELARPSELVQQTLAAFAAGAFDAYRATRIAGTDGHETRTRTTSRAVLVDGHRVGVTLILPEAEVLRPDWNPGEPGSSLNRGVPLRPG